MIALVTDSASMIPPDLRDRFEVAVVPMTVVIDGHEYSEGIDLEVGDFYRRLTGGAEVSTSAPSPGVFAATYRALVDRGVDHIVSIHTGSVYSATVSAAMIAAQMSPVPVSVVDTGLASFPVTLCTWSAAEVLAAGGDPAAAVSSAHRTAARTGSVFVVGVPELARRGGRFVAVHGELTPTSILELGPGGMVEIERVDDIGWAVEVMLARVAELGRDHPLRAGVGDALRPELAAALVDGLIPMAGIAEVLHYEVGPSVGAHTGAGTVGVVYAALDE